MSAAEESIEDSCWFLEVSGMLWARACVAMGLGDG